jgi:hypothetical protein
MIRVDKQQVLVIALIVLAMDGVVALNLRQPPQSRAQTRRTSVR